MSEVIGCAFENFPLSIVAKKRFSAFDEMEAQGVDLSRMELVERVGDL